MIVYSHLLYIGKTTWKIKLTYFSIRIASSEMKFHFRKNKVYIYQADREKCTTFYFILTFFLRIYLFLYILYQFSFEPYYLSHFVSFLLFMSFDRNINLILIIVSLIMTKNMGWLVNWVLWHINLCRSFNAKIIFIQIISSISNNSV